MARSVPVRLNVNGTEHELEVEPRLLLVHALRDHLGLTGTHVGCDTSTCGACTIHLDGRPVKVGVHGARRASGRRRDDDDRGTGQRRSLHPMQQAFWRRSRPAVWLLHARA